MPTPPCRTGQFRKLLPGGGLLLVLALLALSFPLAAVDPPATAQQDLPADYQAWLDEVDSILTKEERAAFLNLDKDYQRDAFIERFWQARDPFPDTVRNELRETWTARVDQARANFGSLKEERARFFLLNGPPAARRQQADRKDRTGLPLSRRRGRHALGCRRAGPGSRDFATGHG